MRAIGVLSKCSLGLFIIIGSFFRAGCGSPGKAPTQTSQPGLTPPTWQSILLPRSNLELLGYAVSPVNPATIYACTIDGSSLSQNSIALWYTRDAGQRWSSLNLPTEPGTGCQIALAPTQPQRIVVLVTNPGENSRPCDNDILYISNNSGNSWQHVLYSSIAPEGAQTTFCQVTVSSHYLYLTYSFIGEENSPQVSLLERTDDTGTTWTRIDTPFGSNALFLPPQIGTDDTLAVIVRHSPPTSEDEPTLWMSSDGGTSWRQAGTLPNPIGTFLLTPPSSNTSWLAAATPFYALAAEQIPSNFYRLRVFESGNGQQWSTIPPLPVSGVNAVQPGLLQTLAVTGNGHLLAFGVNPKSGLPGSADILQKTSAFWLWMWNPHTSRWQVLPTPLNHPADESCGLCWNAQVSSGSDQVSYLYVYRSDEPSSFFYVRLPSSWSA